MIITIHSTYQTQACVAEVGKFKKQLTLTDLMSIGLGVVFGSGWLFAVSHTASIAGPAGIVSWVIGEVTVLLLGTAYRELGAAPPRAGGVTHYPVFSHGELMRYLFGFIALIAFSSLISIEIVAAWRYAATRFPVLTQTGLSDPALLGWVVQFLLLYLFFGLNYYSIKVFVRSDNTISTLKFLVSLTVVVTLSTFFKPENLHVQGIAPFGMSGVEAAINADGIIFAYLGLTPIISVTSEAKNPRRTISVALILSMALSTIIYASLQLASFGSIPTDVLGGGWAEISKQFSLPYRDVVITLDTSWLVFMVIRDAIVSPDGTDNIYVDITPRVIYGWARTGTFFKMFTHIDKESDIPRPVLWLAFALPVFWTLPFPSWEQLIGVASVALVLSYAIAPITAAGLRCNAPDLPRPFHVRVFGIIGPVSFVTSTLVVFQSGWDTLLWLLGLQIVMFVVYTLCRSKVLVHIVGLAQQAKSSLWLITFCALIMPSFWLSSPGDTGVIGHPWDMVMVAVISLRTCYWGERTCLPQASFTGDEEE